MVRRASALAAGLVAMLLACGGAPEVTDPPSPDGDGDGDGDPDMDADTDPDMDPDMDPDTDEGPVPGSFTHVVEHAAFEVERYCDIDGDGALDNALADMGSPAGEMLAMIVNTAMEGELEVGERFVLHYPEVDDIVGPTDEDILVLVFGGIDQDDPPDATDDFDGDEGFYVGANWIDACGEPLFYFDEGYFEEGSGWSGGRLVTLPLGAFSVFTATESFGSFEPYGAAGEGTTCLYATIYDLAEGGVVLPDRGLTLLELLVAGGRPLGMDTVPGANPDLDLDGDGLELVVVDDEGHVTRCIDGDRTIIEGWDCWADPCIQDGFSFVASMVGVSAHLAGLEPSWQHLVEGSCDEPPEQSKWGDTLPDH